MTTLTKETLRPGVLIAHGRDLYTVSNLYDTYFTVRQDYPTPLRTTVHKIPYEELLLFRPATEREVQKIQEAYA